MLWWVFPFSLAVEWNVLPVTGVGPNWDGMDGPPTGQLLSPFPGEGERAACQAEFSSLVIREVETPL